MSKTDIKPWEKFESLERAVLRDTPCEVLRLFKDLGNVEFTARALGIACRFRGLDMVKALVEGGASFWFNPQSVKKSHQLIAPNVAFYSYEDNYALALLEYINLAFLSDIYRAENKYNFKLVSIKERLSILEYLFENADKVSFDSEKFLFYTILTDEREMTEFLRNKGVRISEDKAILTSEGKNNYDYGDYCRILFQINNDRFIPVLTELLKEVSKVTENNKLHFSYGLWEACERKLLIPENFDFFLNNFNQVKMNKKRIMERLIDHDNAKCLEIASNNGWLKQPKKRDEMIQYATDKEKIECVAFLLDFKNRTADLKAEREKAEKKAERELNADPYSLTSLKKSWSFKKKEDGTLIITGYKGNSTVITVPQKIGEDRVTEIDDWAFSPYAYRIKEPTRQFRRTIRKIVLPEGLNKIGTSAFCELSALESVNIPKSVRSIGEYAFRDCYSLKSIIVPEGVTDIGNNAFSMLDGKGELEYAELPSTLDIFKKDCKWWRPYLFNSKNCPKLIVAVPHAPHVEEFCEHNKIKFIYTEDKKQC